MITSAEYSHLVGVKGRILLDGQIQQGLTARLVHRVTGKLHHLHVQVRSKGALAKVHEAEAIRQRCVL